MISMRIFYRSIGSVLLIMGFNNILYINANSDQIYYFKLCRLSNIT